MFRDKIAEGIEKLCVKLGIDPIYFVMLLMLSISLLTLNDIKQWKELSFTKKAYDIVGWISTALILVLGLLVSIKRLFE